MLSSFSLLSFLKVFALSFYLHPLHISVTEINYDQKDKALEIMMRVFMDDLEVTLQQHFQNPKLDIMNPAGKTVDDMMKDYLNSHFRVMLDGKQQKLHYLGHEDDGDAFVFYIEVSNVKKWKEISVFNDIIMEIYDDQSNLVHVTVDNEVRSLRLTKSNMSDNISFSSR